MKKIANLLLVLCMCLSIGIMLTACAEEHTHTLTKVDAVAATCDCGEKGTETFEYGEYGGHNWENNKCSVCSKDFYSEGLKYTVSTGKPGYVVSGKGDCEDTDIVIPSTYNGQPVVGIGNQAFRECDNILSITIPNSVTSIEGAAFMYCSSLKTVVLPDGITIIDDYTFEYCSSNARQ